MSHQPPAVKEDATEASTVSAGAPCALPGTPLAAVRSGIDACVHCGFCLQACPTYLNLEDENDSPRGRILLMRHVLEGSLSVGDASVKEHIDRCLGCRACETVCPSGVPYGHMLEGMRATMLLERRMPPIARLILATFKRPWLLGLAMTGSRLFRATGLPRVLGRFLPGRLGFAMAMLAATDPPIERRKWTPKGDGTRGSTAVLTGCVMEGLMAPTNRATERVLEENGYRNCAAPGQRCCGALHAHAGDLTGARELAIRNVEAFEKSGCDYVAVNASGCGAMMKEYGQLLHDDPVWAERAAAVSAKVRDVSELLAAAGPAPAGPLEVTVTYDAPCHLLHAQRVSAPPLQVLGAIEGLTLVPLEAADQCCGSAGIYNLIEPDTSNAVLKPKLERIRESGAPEVATGNPGCLMQIGAGLHRAGVAARAVHPVELLDESYERARSGAPPAVAAR
ncbi:MAG TPA: heterodisulfide reductase-related iron-sulfur binding cluster [Gemmatimonadaceae bacterium]|nr:heterodisulfide reductase-related iron-sulfur binding cluster [Gemmatimonadaceae bacterium]